jgi:hypothetical protein
MGMMNSRALLLGLLGLAIACSFAGGAQAGAFFDGNRLFNLCTRPVSYAQCAAYILGVADAAWLASADPGRAMLGAYRWCSPSAVLSGQLVDVVAQYLQRNPQDRHLAASSLIADALQNAWPCRPVSAR